MEVEFETFLEKYIEKANPLYDFQISKKLVYEKWLQFCEERDIQTTHQQFNSLMMMAGFIPTFKHKTKSCWIGIRWK